MFETFVVYLTLFLSMILLTHVYQKKQCCGGFYLVAGIILYSLIVGCRYDVGVDYLSYKSWFEHPSHGRHLETDWLRFALSYCGFEFITFFIVMAAMQISFFLLALRKQKSIIVYATFFFFTTLQFFLSMNVMRQVLVWCIFLYSIQYIEKRDLLRYSLFIMISCFFHKSAIVLLIFYFIPWQLLPNRIIQWICYFTLFSLGSIFQENISDIFANIASYIGYGSYSTQMSYLMTNVDWNSENSFGIARLLWLITNSLCIWLYPSIRIHVNSKWFIICYSLYLIGISLDCIVGGTILDRVTMYFLPFRIIIYAYLIEYLFSLKSIFSKLLACSILVLFISFYLYSGIYKGASGCSPFEFAVINWL